MFLNSTQKSKIFQLHNVAIDDMEDDDDYDDLEIEEISYGDYKELLMDKDKDDVKEKD
jgi:hypothetical protein